MGIDCVNEPESNMYNFHEQDSERWELGRMEAVDLLLIASCFSTLLPCNPLHLFSHSLCFDTKSTLCNNSAQMLHFGHPTGFYFREFSLWKESSGLGSLHESNTKDKYIREFYEARQMCVLKESQVSNICLLIEG